MNYWVPFKHNNDVDDNKITVIKTQRFYVSANSNGVCIAHFDLPSSPYGGCMLCFHFIGEKSKVTIALSTTRRNQKNHTNTHII
jgi:hypothetical protein